MYNIVLAVHIIFAIAMIGLILIQHGKGADAGASFGAGASGTVFGAAGSANFLSRATGILAGLFFITSLTLAAFARKEAQDQLRLDVVDTAPVSTPMAHTPPPAPTVATPAPSTVTEPTNATEITQDQTQETVSTPQNAGSTSDTISDTVNATSGEQVVDKADDITKPLFNEKASENAGESDKSDKGGETAPSDTATTNQ